jgi:Tfp pilus assembly protein PilE
MIMKSLIQAVAIAAVLAVPVASFAQSNQPVTRAQVRAELVQVEQAGYNPSHGRDPYYPSDIQAAEARVASQNGYASRCNRLRSGRERYDAGWPARRGEGQLVLAAGVRDRSLIDRTRTN